MIQTGHENRNETWELVLSRVQNFTVQKGINSFVNPFSMLKLAESKSAVEGVDYFYVDGISLVKFIKMFTGKIVGRYSFDDTSVAPTVFNHAKQNHLKIAVIGTTADNLKKSVDILEKRYQFKIDYSRDGFFKSPEDRRETIQHISTNNYDLVICGMGTPLQEIFLIDLKNAGWGGFGYTCGGYLHQLATKEKYYPKIFDTMNIRWIYRIYDEPKLFHRYFVLYPKFALHFISFHLNRKKK